MIFSSSQGAIHFTFFIFSCQNPPPLQSFAFPSVRNPFPVA
jgi:hypothetical protein